MISYCRFDLQSLPKSSWFHYVSVDSAELRLLAQSFGLPDETTKCFVTVNYCSQDDWSESGMTWDSRVGKERLEGQDSIVINGTDLPKIYMWDVTAGVVKAKSMGNSKITFELEGLPLTVHTLGAREIVPGEEFGPDTTLVGFVRFWSKGAFAIWCECGAHAYRLLFHSRHRVTQSVEFHNCGFVRNWSSSGSV